MVLPNFLIVGAPKSGTTSLNYYLKEHPQVFMSSVKEPYFFSSQMDNYPNSGPDKRQTKVISDITEYIKLFTNGDGFKAIGEASTNTMYYFKTSIPAIHRHIGDPKIIILLRNPVDRAFSAYTHLLRENREKFNFEYGLDHETERINLGWNSIWHYKAVGLYAKQVEAFLNSFSNVKIWLYDDLQRDQGKVIREVYQFLEVDDTFEPPNESVRYNVSGIPKIAALNNLLTMKNPLQRVLRSIGIGLFSENRYVQIREIIRSRNLVKPSLDIRARNELIKYFSKDIETLQTLISRDLSSWVNT